MDHTALDWEKSGALDNKEGTRTLYFLIRRIIHRSNLSFLSPPPQQTRSFFKDFLSEIPGCRFPAHPGFETLGGGLSLPSCPLRATAGFHYASDCDTHRKENGQNE